jgi:hypothetical protein
MTTGSLQDKNESVKIKAPDTYDGHRAKLTPFLTQCELYMMFNSKKFQHETEQVLFIVSLLRGAAYNWVSPFLVDFLKNKTSEGRCSKNMKKETIQYFQTMKGFGDGINQVFGDIEEERTAERGLQNLKQKGAATSYTAEFQQLATRTQWGEAALQAQYYKGLKDHVKDEISRSDKPDDLSELIAMAVKIDNRAYERSLEKRGTYSHSYKKEHPKKNKYHSPMELDATTKGKKPLSKEEMDKRRKNKLCFECGLPGHMASSHRKNGAPWKQKKQLNATGRGGYDMTGSKQICVIEEVGTFRLPRDSQTRGTRRRILAEDQEELDRDLDRRHRQWLESYAKGRSEEQLERDHVHTQFREYEESDAEPSGQGQDTPEESDEETSESAQQGVDIHKPLEWPTTWPQEGQVWKVVHRELFPDTTGTREWRHIERDTLWREPGEAVAGGPEWGTSWEVTYQDHRRIGWRQVGGSGLYMLHVPQPEPLFQNNVPTLYETWELVAQGRKERMWMNTQDDTKFYREAHVPGRIEGFTIGQVYRLIDCAESTNATTLSWLNVLWEFKDDPKGKELAATEGTGHLVCDANLKGYAIKVMIDTGATGNFISPRVVRQLNLGTQVKAKSYTLAVVNGKPIDGEQGIVDVETDVMFFEMPGGHLEKMSFDITNIGRHDAILGTPWMRKHNPEIDWTTDTLSFAHCQNGKCIMLESTKGIQKIQLQRDQEAGSATAPRESGYQQIANIQPMDPLLKQIPEEYREFLNLFKEERGIEALPQHGPWDHGIPLEEGKEPPFLPIYQMSEADLGTLREYLDENLKKGFIRPSTSPAGSPVLLVPKKDGKKRLCVDYRKLNAITIKDRYALPLADELRDRLVGAKMFTKLDLRGAYNLIRMKEGEEWKTAFRCRYGHYEYTVMPFGLTNAPASCMRMMNEILREYLDRMCIAYLDDILIYSKTRTQHVQDVKTVLRALKAARLLCKPEKCEFFTKKVEFLGYIVTPGGLSMDVGKVNAILEWSEPTNVKDVQSFLGFANFYRRFVKGYSAITVPLTELTKKGEEFKWTSEAQKAFDKLKTAFTQAPILLTFDAEKEIVVETDSSDYALGAVLSQKGDDGK